MTKAEFQNNPHYAENCQAMIHRQVAWLTGMLSVARRALGNYRHNECAAFQNNVEALRLMATDNSWLSMDQRDAIIPIADLAKKRPEALRGLSGVIKQFLRELSRQVMSKKAG